MKQKFINIHINNDLELLDYSLSLSVLLNTNKSDDEPIFFYFHAAHPHTKRGIVYLEFRFLNYKFVYIIVVVEEKKKKN